ncbi:MAG: hypothetical protein JW725_05605 [Candidatus Babeliaceae bacterium]|nr:hypothetical protein [Candidatus Babeliaceae bacterium]
MKNVWPYRVDGEVGRIEFPTYRVIQGEMTPYDSARELFPPLGCWERYETRGFKELAFIRGVTETSYNKTALWVNRIRHQPGATGSTTLRVGAEREGRKVLAYLERTTSEILKHAGCDDTGQPLDPTSRRTKEPLVMSAEFVAEAIAACHLTADERAEVERNPVPYEHPTDTVNVSIDDVVVKHQKQHRAHLNQDSDNVAHEETNSGRKYVHDTIAHLQHQEHSYCIAGPSVPAVLRILLGYLLTNVLLGCRLQFFVDGQKTLQAAIFKAFAWLSQIGMILDWYHLEDKCARQLSLAMKGAALRNEALAELSSLLWYGRVESAKAFLHRLPDAHLKNPDEIRVLIEYLERNRPSIPCYAVRKHLGLRNSSNIGEKMNDLLVSDRQKHHGMSWSAGGSMALAALEALKRNNEYQHWFEYHEIDLKQVA